ncbi:MAG: alpha/beta hydrolase [Myxococcota bacterium]
MNAAYREKAMSYGQTTPLTGVLTLPVTPAPSSQPVIVFLNAGLIHHVGPNRLHVTLARALAGSGYTSCRFDLAGIGDSPHRGDGQPIPEGVAADIRATLDHLESSLGARRFVLFGLCAGADNALASAATDPRVDGCVLLDPSIHRTRAWYGHYYAGRATRLDSWKSVLTGRHPAWRRLTDRALRAVRPEPNFAACDDLPSPEAEPEFFRSGPITPDAIGARWRAALARGARFFVVFTLDWGIFYSYADQLYDCYPDIDFGRTALHHRPETRHTFTTESDRNWLVESVIQWLRTSPAQDAR